MLSTVATEATKHSAQGGWRGLFLDDVEESGGDDGGGIGAFMEGGPVGSEVDAGDVDGEAPMHDAAVIEMLPAAGGFGGCGRGGGGGEGQEDLVEGEIGFEHGDDEGEALGEALDEGKPAVGGHVSVAPGVAVKDGSHFADPHVFKRNVLALKSPVVFFALRFGPKASLDDPEMRTHSRWGPGVKRREGKSGHLAEQAKGKEKGASGRCLADWFSSCRFG